MTCGEALGRFGCCCVMTLTTMSHSDITVMSRVLPALQHDMSPHLGTVVAAG